MNAIYEEPSGYSIKCYIFYKMTEFKGATSRLAHLEKNSLNVSSSSFAIRLNLLHPQLSLFLFGLLLPLWFFCLSKLLF